ncbi:hypothetical protein PLANPX_1486 [Lacipirellula parvula]|uniref:Uncharacterized protein n=1 Tax=Lacipirellula parvula TaxID=2650471 RepID=A0A5K7X596_9BACT|nr:hypothetical protein PLANPX_1486 [Lacipirellula parvula]
MALAYVKIPSPSDDLAGELLYRHGGQGGGSLIVGVAC